MKKIYLILVLALFASTINAQVFRLNAYGNYAMGQKYHMYENIAYPPYNYYQGSIEGAPMWGAGLEYRLKERVGIEAIYLTQKTHATAIFNDENHLDLTTQYILAGGSYSFTQNNKWEPYGGAMMGVALLQSLIKEESVAKQETKFSFGFKFGVNYWITRRVGAKFQLQYLLVPKGAGGDLYFNNEENPTYPNEYTSLSQFVVGGGLSFRLGR